MNELPLFEISELNKEILSSDNFRNQFIVADIFGSHFPSEDPNALYSLPLRMNALTFVLILQGTVKVGIDYTLYTLGKNSFITIMPTHTVQIYMRSEDFKAKMVVISKGFLDGCNPSKTPPSASLYMQIRKNPCATIEPVETRVIDASFQLFCEKIRMKNHHFQLEVLQNTFVGFTLELGNIFIGKEKTIKQPILTRKEEVFQQFLEILLANCKTEHSVSYYAEKLFITPQYLSLILKELTGKSASKWIDEALILEAKVLLKAPSVTVQQVADTLQFSDQSTFGKFFKKYMGVSPLEYRKS